MTAFNALERRALDLSLAGSQDTSDPIVVVGLFAPGTTTSSTGVVTQNPMPEDHDGRYGLAGEPLASAVGAVGYRRARARFGTATVVAGKTQVVNTEPITITGLSAGTYTHFGVFGSSTAGQG